MGLGRNCCILIFPLVGTALAMALGVVAIFMSNPHSSPLDKLFLMRLDFSDINANAVTGLSGSLASDVNSAISNLKSELGIADFYDVGVSGYCQGTLKDKDFTVDDCFTPSLPFWFDLEGILKNATNPGIDISIPSQASDYSKIIETASKAMWVCYVASAGILALSFLAGLFTFHSRFINCCAFMLSLLGTLLSIAASGLATGIFLTYKHFFNEEVDKFGIKASLDGRGYAITWIATAAAIWAAFWWLISMCCGSTTRHRSREVVEEKEPFIGFQPAPYEGARYH